MTGESEAAPGFAAAHDVPIPYLQRTRDYYQALGYGAPYVWAHYADVPFRLLSKPLGEMPRRADHDRGAVSARQGRPGTGSALQRSREVLRGLLRRRARSTTICASRTSRSTACTPRREDAGIVLSAAGAAPRSRARAGSASVAPRFHGAPTNRSHRATLEVDCPELVARCRDDAVDAAILVAELPGLPPDDELSPRACSRRTASPPSSWAARRTSSSTSACRAFCSPTFRSATPPGGRTTPRRRRSTLDLALRVLEHAPAPRTTVQSPLRWSDERRLEARLLQRRAPDAGGDRAGAPSSTRRKRRRGSAARKPGIRARLRPGSDRVYAAALQPTPAAVSVRSAVGESVDRPTGIPPVIPKRLRCGRGACPSGF